MDKHQQNDIMERLFDAWSEVEVALSDKGLRLELRHHGCEGGAATLHLVDVNTDVEVTVDESP